MNKRFGNAFNPKIPARKRETIQNKHPNASLVEVEDYLKSLRVNLKKKAEIIVNKNI